MNAGPLAHIRVVEVVDLRGALCGRILADLGAEVVKVLPPTGGDDPTSAAYRYRNANKLGALVDLHDGAGQSELDSLLATADVLIDNLGPRHAARHGLDPVEVAARHPHLVHVALTDFGLAGPRSGWRLEPLPGLAAAGTLWATGFPGAAPVGLPGFLAHDCASVFGAAGAVAALLERAVSGTGQVVEVSTQEAGLAGTCPWSVAIADYIRINPMLDPAGTRNADGAYWVLPAKDGWVRTVIGTPKQWAGFVALCGKPDALMQPEWEQPGFRLANRDVVRLLASECLTDRTRAELLAEALVLDTTVGVLHTLREFVDHPQTKHRGFFVDGEVVGLPGAPFAAAPCKMSVTPPSLRAPAPTAHTAVPVRQLAALHDRTPRSTGGVGPGSTAAVAGAATNADTTTAAGAATKRRLPLDGLRVVEFGMAAVVPEMCGVLAELGADVVKIESHHHPDVLRLARSSFNQNFTFNTEARGRRGVTLDINSARGHELAIELCKRADIVAENMRGGVLDRLGFGYDAVRATNPSVIYASSQGYGRGGPYGEMPAFGPLNAGFAGLHHLWSDSDGPYPCGTSLNHPDHIAGRLLSVAVLAALEHRRRTGAGQHIDLAQTEAAAYLIGELYIEATTQGTDLPVYGNHSTTMAPHGVYRCAGEDSWVAIAVHSDQAWRELQHVTGWVHDPALATAEARVATSARINELLGEWTASRTNVAIAEELQARGVSAMPVMGPIDHHADPHLAERGFIVTLQHPEVGPERHAGNPLRLSGFDQRTSGSAPCLGADTASVLEDWLGMTPDEAAALAASDACY